MIFGIYHFMVIGHQKQLDILNTARQSGRISHAYILSGPSRVGKKTVALEWLSQILGAQLDSAAVHPDFIFVEPLTDPKTGKRAGEITVAQVRSLIWKLSLTPAIAPVIAALIDDAHLMNTEAQNALLKTLEEPPGNAIIVLVAQNSNRLLETIRSRCQTLQFNFVSLKDMQKFAGLKGSGNSAEIVRLSFGRPGRMVEFAADPDRLKAWQDKAAEFSRAVSAGLPDRFAYAAKAAEDQDLDELLEVWQSHFRDKMLDALNGKGQSAPQAAAKDQFVFSKLKNAPAASPQKIASVLKKIHELGVVLQTTNASPRLAIENFMLEI